MLILHNALCNSRNRHGNAVVGRTLALYDLIGAVAHLLIQALHGCLVVEMSPQFAEMIQIDSGHIRPAPHRKFAVAMLTDDNSMNAAAVHIQMSANLIFESRRIQNRTGAKDSLHRITGYLLCRIGQHIHWIGDYH